VPGTRNQEPLVTEPKNQEPSVTGTRNPEPETTSNRNQLQRTTIDRNHKPGTTSESDVMGTVLRYLFLPTELLLAAGTRPSSAHLQYCWYPGTLLYYPVLASTTCTLQYLNSTCASFWRPSHGTFCTGLPLDYSWSMSHASR
jgi:hypothetical protein